MKFVNFIIYLFIIVMLISCVAPKTSQEKHDNIIAGEVSWDYWKENAGWSLYEAYDYEPKQKDIEKLKILLKEKDYSFIIFATTYCDECEENLPKLFKVFEYAEVPGSRIRLFGLDEKEEEPSGEYKKFRITTTPHVFLTIDSVIIGEAGYPYLWLKNFIEILELYNK